MITEKEEERPVITLGVSKDSNAKTEVLLASNNHERSTTRVAEIEFLIEEPFSPELGLDPLEGITSKIAGSEETDVEELSMDHWQDKAFKTVATGILAIAFDTLVIRSLARVYSPYIRSTTKKKQLDDQESSEKGREAYFENFER